MVDVIRWMYKDFQLNFSVGNTSELILLRLNPWNLSGNKHRYLYYYLGGFLLVKTVGLMAA
eukprot:14249688-Ditylum_brightwellii.AAC.1